MEELEAAGFTCQAAHDGSAVRLVFYDEAGTECPVVIPQSGLSALAQELLGKISQGSVRPISQHGMPIGTIFRMVGSQIAPRTGGGARLTLHIEMDDGGRSLPIDLPPDQLQALVDDLSARL